MALADTKTLYIELFYTFDTDRYLLIVKYPPKKGVNKSPKSFSDHFSEAQPSPKLPWSITSRFYRLGVVFRFVVKGFGGWFDFWGHMGLPRQLNVYIG